MPFKKTSIPSRAEYKCRERDDFLKSIREASNGSPEEIAEAEERFKHDLAADPALIDERLSWLIGGHYGYGACWEAHIRIRAALDAEGKVNLHHVSSDGPAELAEPTLDPASL